MFSFVYNHLEPSTVVFSVSFTEEEGPHMTLRDNHTAGALLRVQSDKSNGRLQKQSASDADILV